MNPSKILILQDNIVEVLHNDMLSNRPYLMRLTGWNTQYDFRASKEELENLAGFILSFIGESNDD